MSAVNAHLLGAYNSLHLGQVTDNADPDMRGRVKVRLQANVMEVWASVISLSAGNGYGSCFIPRVDEIVVLAFVTPDLPMVIGSIWAGQNSVPADADPHEEHYVIRTPSGTVIEIDDAEGPKVEIRTNAGHYLRLTDDGGGEIEAKLGGQSVKLTSSEISVTASGPVNIEGATVNVSAGSVNVDAGMSKFSGVVKADTVITNSVVSSSYTPGAGNIW